jgi:hypothetical protein
MAFVVGFGFMTIAAIAEAIERARATGPDAGSGR